MYRIREKPTSAKSSRSPGTHKNIEDLSFNENSQNNHMLNQNSRADRNFPGFFNIRRLYKKQRIKQVPSSRQNNTINKPPRSTSASKKEVSPEQIQILKEELQITWKNFGITEQHQKIFMKNIANIHKIQAAVKIAREIDNIEKGNASIVSVLNAINSREGILQRLLEKNQENPKFEVISSVKTIETLREITLQVIEIVENWKKENFTDEEFIHKGLPYYEKMQKDCDFFYETNLSKYFNLCKSDPLFIGPTTSKIVNKKEYIIPLGYKHHRRVAKACEILSYKPVKPLKIRSVAAQSEENSSVVDLTHTELSQVFPSESLLLDLDLRKEMVITVKVLMEEMIETEICGDLPKYIHECFSEIITASLTLYSSSILDIIISKVLGELIPAVAKESHTEVTDSEYIDIRNLIIDEVMEEQIRTISSNNTSELLSKILAEEVVGSIELFQITLQTIEEENKENLSIVYIVADKIIEEFINEDWTEDIAEFELVSAKMEFVWKDLPPHIQKEIYLHQKERILRRIDEMIYFAILNEFVGGFWIEGICKSVYREYSGGEALSDEEVFILKDPNVVIDEIKRNPVFRMTRKK